MVSVLATLGVRVIRTLGIDGGTAYAPKFSDVEARTKFANRHTSFDLQWQGIAATVRRWLHQAGRTDSFRWIVKFVTPPARTPSPCIMHPRFAISPTHIPALVFPSPS